MNSAYDVKPRQLRALVLLLVLLPFVPAMVTFRFIAETIRGEREAVEERFSTLYSSHLNTATGFFENQLAVEFDDFQAPSTREEALAVLEVKGLDGLLLLRDDGSQLAVGDMTQRLDGMWVRDRLSTLSPAAWMEADDSPGIFLFRVDGGTTLLLRGRRTLAERARSFYQASFGIHPSVRVTSPDGVRYPLLETPGEVIAARLLSRHLPGWTISLHSPSGVSIDGAVAEQIAAYRRIAFAVVGVILAIATLAGYAVTRQMRLNELRLTGVATVAHELKTPIASMRLLLDTLVSGSIREPAQREEYLELMRKENLRLGSLVEGFLTLLRMENRSYSPRLRLCRPKEFLDPAIAAVEIRLKELGFELQRQETAEPELLADPDALATAVTNLLENAIKYSRQERFIRIHTAADSRFWTLRIADRGVGLERSEIRRIFRPFYQADSKLSREQGGTGLGLSIVRRIVKAHRGRISVDSEPGKGSVFVLQLPLK